MNALESVGSGNFDVKCRAYANGLLKNVTTFDFIVSLMFMRNVMYKLKNLTESLESSSLNILDAMTLVDACISILKSIIASHDKEIDNLIDSAAQFASSIGVTAEDDFQRHHRRRLRPHRFQENSSNQVQFTLHSFYKKEFRCVLAHYSIIRKRSTMPKKHLLLQSTQTSHEIGELHS